MERLFKENQGHGKEVSSVFQENFNEKFLSVKKCFNEVLFSNYVLAWISSQLPD